MERTEALERVEYMKRLVADTRYRVESGYQFFLLWGVIWVAGYLGVAFLDEDVAGPLWGILATAGAVASWVIGALIGRNTQPRHAPFGRKLLQMNALLIASVFAVPALFFEGPFTNADVNAYIPFMVGLIYMINGIFLSPLFLSVGAGIAAAAGVSLAFTEFGAAIWMATVGGGGLLVSGIALRGKHWGTE